MSDIVFDNLGPGEYDRAKKVFDKAKHPGFVGRELFWRCAISGVACIAVIDGVDTGIALVAKEKLQALSVIVTAQGSGAGTALMARLRPKWVSAIDDRVEWFQKRGYEPFGAAKVGQNGKHAVQLMQRRDDAEAADAQPQQTTTQVPKIKKRSDAEVEREAAANAFEGTAISPSVAATLFSCADRGVPKRMAAYIAGIGKSTLYEWFARTDEPYVSFAREYMRRFHERGASLIDSVAIDDPKYLLGAVYRVKQVERREVTGKNGKPIAVEGGSLTDEQLLEKARMLTSGESG